MGHFKSISRKKRKYNYFLYGIIVFILIILFTIFCKRKWQISNAYLQEFLALYMQIDLNNEENEYLVTREANNMGNHLNMSSEPLVYIYNTHQSEKYAHNVGREFNIDYDVLFASQILKSYLDDNNTYSIVEMTSINNLLKKNNYQYSQSYEISRNLLEKAKDNYPSLKYFIDLHRDSSDYETTTCIINDQKYARFLFVLGLDHDNYKQNETVIKNLNERIKEQNECLSRGIMRKSGNGVNGIYNQDFDQNVMLIEVGGQYNSITEVNNSLEILAMVLANYIKEYI